MSFNWNDNSQAFPRLIAALESVGARTDRVMEALCEEMKLEPHEIETIVVRAEREWERIKERA